MVADLLTSAINAYGLENLDAALALTFLKVSWLICEISPPDSPKSVEQLSLFDEETESQWYHSATGREFCDTSRYFFAKFIERYMKYFLEREASGVLQDIELREQFNIELQRHIYVISHHAFETSKIMQSFAAGWFNKHVKNDFPSNKSIRGFLSLAFGKIREEVRREGRFDE